MCMCVCTDMRSYVSIYIYLSILSINQFYQLVRVKTELVNNSKALLASDSGKTLKFLKLDDNTWLPFL